MNNKTIERIEREIGIPGLAALLSEKLSPTDLQSLLLEVFRQKAQQRQPAAVLADYENNRFVRPAAVSPVKMLAWEQVAFANLPADFQPMMLSPVTPLGTNSAVALVDQNWSVSTIRNTEVVSDSTNVLALECSARRRQLLRADPKSLTPVHLATNQRLLRAQHYDNPNFASHFSIFALCSAGRDQGNLQFELSAFTTHINFYIRSLKAFLPADVPLQVAVTDFSTRHTSFIERLFTQVHAEFPDIPCVIEDQRTSGRDYYADLCFHIYAGDSLQLADGGAVNWTQKLLSNAKERCVISGIGSERVCLW